MTNERPKTVKLNRDEWTGLIMSVVAQIGVGPAKAAVHRALGDDRAEALIERYETTNLTRQDNIRLVQAFYPLIPGIDRAAKTQWLIRVGRTVFVDDDRLNEVLAYVTNRIEEHEQANGEFDPNKPIPPPQPAPEPAPEPPPVNAEVLPFDPTKINQAKNRVDIGRMAVADLLKFADCDNRGHVRYNNDLPGSWWSGEAATKFARMHAVVEVRPGVFEGGHFDWCRKGQEYKTLGNLTNGYTGFVAPKGARIWLCLIANHAKARTKYVESKTRFGG